jgi:hypothetical protein
MIQMIQLTLLLQLQLQQQLQLLLLQPQLESTEQMRSVEKRTNLTPVTIPSATTQRTLTQVPC